MLEKRIISTVILVFITALTIFIDWFFRITITIFIVAGLYEFFAMLEKKGISIYKYFGIGMGAIIPISTLWQFELTKNWELLFVVLALLFLILMQFSRRQNTGAILDISTTIFGILYVSWFFSFLIKIRYLLGGVGLFVAVLLITKLGDIGAYLVGSRFGSTPLLPRISPKKSVEGAFGGLIFSILGALFSQQLLNPALACKSGVNLSYWHLIFIGAALGILGQLGDLSESLMKRDCGVKDSGFLIPGIGGVLDLIDSLLFTAPAFYFYMSIILK
jgi:phosphatidate cytidylyltransferase